MTITREWLYKKPLMPPKMTSDEAFELGKKVARGEVKGETAYDVAARAFARAIVECVERHPKEWKKVAKKFTEAKKPENTGENWSKRGKGEDLLFEGIHLFEKSVADDEYKKIVEEIAPSMFQAGWAFQVAFKILEEVQK